MRRASLLRMIIRHVLTQHRVDALIDRIFGAGPTGKDMSGPERQQRQSAAQQARRSKKAIRLLRRFGRF